jgi:hypothetical protein
MKRLRRVLLAIATLLLFATSSFVCQRVAERGRFTGSYSSYGSGPLGTRALYLLAEQLGGRPQRWAEDLAALPRGAGMLVALSDCEAGMARPLSRYEDAELTRWVADGGTLLVAGARHYLPEKLGVSFENEAHCSAGWRFRSSEHDDDKHPVIPTRPAFEPPTRPKRSARDAGTRDAGARDAGAANSEDESDDAEIDATNATDQAQAEGVAWVVPVAAPLEGLTPLPMRRPGRLVLAKDAHYSAILSQPSPSDAESGDLPAGVVVRHGKGHVIALASASMLQNRALGLSDGGVVFARLLQTYAARGPVLFDEYHLGVGEKRSLMRYLRQAGATPLLLALLLATLLLLWRSGARFGGIREPLSAAPNSTASFVAAMGGLFARSADRSGALRVLIRQALARVAGYHHLPLGSAQQLARSLQERGLADAAAAVRAIEHAEQHDAGASLAASSQRLDAAVARACR